MPDTPAHPGPDDPTSEFKPITPAVEPDGAAKAASDADSNVDTDAVEQADPGRFIRTWVWMIVVSGFGLFLVFGSVSAHYWEENARGTFYVPVTEGMQVLDIWRAQVNGLPAVTHEGALKAVFLVSVFGFIGLSVIALWLATVEIWNPPEVEKSDSTEGGMAEDTSDAVPAPGASAG